MLNEGKGREGKRKGREGKGKGERKGLRFKSGKRDGLRREKGNG